MTWNTESITALSSGSSVTLPSEAKSRGDRAAAPTGSSLRLSQVLRRRISGVRKSWKSHKQAYAPKQKAAPVVTTITEDQRTAATLPLALTVRSSEKNAVRSEFRRSHNFRRSSWYRKPVRGPRSPSTNAAKRKKTKYPEPAVRTQAVQRLVWDAAAEEPKEEISAKRPSRYLAKPDAANSLRAKAAKQVPTRGSSIISHAPSDVHSSKRYSVQEKHSTVAKGEYIHDVGRRAASCGTLTRPPSYRYAAKPKTRARRSAARVQVWRRPRKIVVIGDMCSGKSGLISAYCKDKFNEMYIPTILHSCLTDARVFGEKIELVVVEVAGREDYARLRRCAYSKMDAVILCYSADNVESLERIKNLWLPELKKHAPKVPYILVGTKKDVKEDFVYQFEVLKEEAKGGQMRGEDLLNTIVTTHRGTEVAKSIGAHGFIECSALYREGTREVFETAAKVALRKSRRKRKYRSQSDPCVIL